MTLCDQGIVVNGACAVLPGSGIQTVNSKTLTVSKDGGNGVLRRNDGVKDFGALHVSAGDRGPVLILDRFGFNDDNVRHTGVIFAVKPSKLAGTEFDGTFNCNTRGNDGASVVVTGTSYTVKDLMRGTTNTVTLTCNKIANTSGVSIDLDGTAIAQNKGATPAQGSLMRPLSSSLAVLSHADGALDIRRKAI